MADQKKNGVVSGGNVNSKVATKTVVTSVEEHDLGNGVKMTRTVSHQEPVNPKPLTSWNAPVRNW